MAHGFSKSVHIIEEEVAVEKNTQSLDYDMSGVLIYQGEAAPGTVKSSAGWSIKKFIYSGDNLVDVLWANGNTDKINIWDDRASLSYS